MTHHHHHTNTLITMWHNPTWWRWRWWWQGRTREMITTGKRWLEYCTMKGTRTSGWLLANTSSASCAREETSSAVTTDEFGHGMGSTFKLSFPCFWRFRYLCACNMECCFIMGGQSLVEAHLEFKILGQSQSFCIFRKDRRLDRSMKCSEPKKPGPGLV